MIVSCSMHHLHHLRNPSSSSGVSSLVTIFSTECSAYHDWQTVVLYDSWKAAKVPGRLVRILACSQASNLCVVYSRCACVCVRVSPHVIKGLHPLSTHAAHSQSK